MADGSDGFDMVSDLNGTGPDITIPAQAGTSAHGPDAVSVNNQNAPREPVSQAKPVGAKEPVAEGDKPKSVRDLISSALKSETATPDAAQQDGRARNPDGTFAPKLVDATLTGEPIITAPAAPVTAAPQGIDPEVYKSLPAETQASLARTMEDLNTRQQRFARLEPIERLIEPRIQAWALGGMAPETALHQLFALSDFAGRDPGGFIKYMANVNNVDLETLVLGMDAEPQVDPAIKALQDEVNALKSGKEQEERQQQQAAHNARVGEVTNFASEKDGQGNVVRPHFDEIGDGILPFISAVKSQNPSWSHTQVLQEAYDRACWGTASVRSKMQAAADAAGAADRLRQQAEKTGAAKAASVSVRSGAPTTAPATPNEVGKSTRDVIRAAMALHS